MEHIVIFKIKSGSAMYKTYCKPAAPYIKEAMEAYSGEFFESERNRLTELSEDLDSVVLLPFDRTGGDVFPFAKEGQVVAILDNGVVAGVVGVSDSVEGLFPYLENLDETLQL